MYNPRTYKIFYFFISGAATKKCATLQKVRNVSKKRANAESESHHHMVGVKLRRDFFHCIRFIGLAPIV